MHTNLPRVIKHRALVAGPITSAPRPLGHSQICPRFPRKPVSQHYRSVLSFPGNQFSQHFRSVLSFPSEQCLVLDFPRPRSGRGVSWCGGMRAARGADGTPAAMYRPARPESEASACRARRTGLQSTGAPSAADFSNSSSCACKPVSSHAQAGLIANPSSRPNADSIDRGHEWTRPTPTMRARGALERSGRGGLGLGL